MKEKVSGYPYQPVFAKLSFGLIPLVFAGTFSGENRASYPIRNIYSYSYFYSLRGDFLAGLTVEQVPKLEYVDLYECMNIQRAPLQDLVRGQRPSLKILVLVRAAVVAHPGLVIGCGVRYPVLVCGKSQSGAPRI